MQLKTYCLVFMIIVLEAFFISLILRPGIIESRILFTDEKKPTTPVDSHLKLKPLNKLKFLSPYGGDWTFGRNACSCRILNSDMFTYDKFNAGKDNLAIKKRRGLQYEQYKKRNESPAKKVIIAQPHSPLSYPTHGVEVKPLYSILIPGLAVHGMEGEKNTVKLTATQGVFNTIVETPDGVVHGSGEQELTIRSPSLAIINNILKHVTYTSKKYQIASTDLVSFQFEEYTAEFVILIRVPPMIRLFDPGPDNSIDSLVTIVTKTFIRYHKLRILISSIRKFYPKIMIIIADDSKVTEKIEGPYIQQYTMPFAKGWFAGRNLAISQVTTKYLLWVDEDFEFTQETKLEKLVEVLEKTNLDLVGAPVSQDVFAFKLWYEEGDDEGDCVFSQNGSFHPLDGFPGCVVTSIVVNFFLAKTEKVWSVGFDPRFARIAHTEFFIDGIGSLLVGYCTNVKVGHQKKGEKDKALNEVENKYAAFRRLDRNEFRSRLDMTYFKNRLKCYTRNRV
ncbi:beta-1,4 N-acetylgalactosaminyltransferase 2-like isoform X1 [Leucoraja erinacea]|uniref:beta-1,4 N-acetylgalactosaminyltransferase 2-like isoform X1 n=2 Tax=Leucoraja erinaceus TaxID=7782 RepID=UPI00245561B8|nr:beta-1,4 N-acetylgalactosaminyltransferase 2-like isoform X1 [Leucoraja erinacea]XP_055513237.1 beta-1,4 N-acetylgalactosaminyltransferase 2-like isoform X1 [Leucoraja erinacea]